MTDLNNKLNINNVRSTYNNTPNFKKEEEVKPQPKAEETPEIINDGTQAADAYGRSLVKQAGKRRCGFLHQPPESCCCICKIR